MKQKQTEKKNKGREFSKLVVARTEVLAWCFVIFACAEMHMQKNLEPIAYIGAGIVGLLSIVVGSYMWRAKQKDFADLEFEKIKKMAALREKKGEHVQDDSLQQVPWQ